MKNMSLHGICDMHEKVVQCMDIARSVWSSQSTSIYLDEVLSNIAN